MQYIGLLGGLWLVYHTPRALQLIAAHCRLMLLQICLSYPVLTQLEFCNITIICCDIITNRLVSDCLKRLDSARNVLGTFFLFLYLLIQGLLCQFSEPHHWSLCDGRIAMVICIFYQMQFLLFNFTWLFDIAHLHLSFTVCRYEVMNFTFKSAPW